MTVWSDVKKEEVRKLWCVHELSASQIGAKYGVSRSTIIGLVHRMGLDGHRGATPDEVRAKAEARRAASAARMNMINERARQHVAVTRTVREMPAKPPKATEPPPGGFLCVPMADRTPDQCSWIVGEPRDGIHCGHSVIPNKSWCFHHHRIVFDRPETPAPFVQRPTVLSIAGGVAV